jgi:uncharacterized protein (DUF58 family)
MNIAWFIIILLVGVMIHIFISARWGLTHVEYQRSLSTSIVFAGEKIDLIDEISNKKLLPVPWLRLESKIDDDLRFQHPDTMDHVIAEGGYHRTLFSLLPYQKVKRRQPVLCSKRGYYQIKTSTLTTGDMVGFGETFKHIASPIELTVYPRLLTPEEMNLPAHSLLGDLIVKRWVNEDPFMLAGVREYAPGDPFKKINWKATARTSNLQVTQQDHTADHHLMIYINFNQTNDVWLPVIDEAIMEHAISYAATVAEYAISNGISTGFGCNSYIGTKPQTSLRIEPENNRRQLMHLLDTMAKLTLDANKSFGSFLQEDIDTPLHGTDILLITMNETAKMMAAIEQLETMGNAVKTVVLESDKIGLHVNEG